MSELTQTIDPTDAHDVTLESLGNFLKDKINKRFPGTVDAIYTSSGILATTFQLNSLNIYRVSSTGNSLQNSRLRIEYIAMDNTDRQSGDANFRGLALAIAQYLREFKMTQFTHVLHPLQIELGSLQCRSQFPMLRIEFDAVESPELQQL